MRVNRLYSSRELTYGKGVTVPHLSLTDAWRATLGQQLKDTFVHTAVYTSSNVWPMAQIEQQESYSLRLTAQGSGSQSGASVT